MTGSSIWLSTEERTPSRSRSKCSLRIAPTSRPSSSHHLSNTEAIGKDKPVFHLLEYGVSTTDRSRRCSSHGAVVTNYTVRLALHRVCSSATERLRIATVSQSL